MRKTVETSKEKRYFQEPAGETVLTHRADSFDEIGLVSVGLPILVGLINSEDKSASVTVADVANCATLRDLVSVLEKNRKVAEGAAGVGARNDL